MRRPLALAFVICLPFTLEAQQGSARALVERWPPHDERRPAPKRVDPGMQSSGDRVGTAPADAVVLFDGRDASGWSDGEGRPAGWIVRDGYLEVRPGAGDIQTRRGFGDAQLHIEWMAPLPVRGTGQDRGNSGVFLMGRYEVQVLDSYDNATYPDGQAAASYGQYPPLVNASRPPGQWQTYDIVFHAPRFDANGRLTRAARLTVLHNGVLVQDDVELVGPTGHRSRPPYEAHADKLPIKLQDHGAPVRFRNIWIRELTSP
jgi:hypothetical protein